MTRPSSLIALASLLFATTVCSPARADEIKIGVLAPTTGTAASEGQDMANAVLLAIDELNRRGGPNTYTAVVGDDGCDPQQAVNAATRLASAGVSAVIGGYCSGATLPALKIFDDAKLPFVITAANSADLISADPGGAFMISSTDKDQIATALNVWQAKDVKSLAVVSEVDAYSQDLAKLTQRDFPAAGGTVAAFETVTGGRQDYSELVAKITAANADAVFWTANGADGAVLIRQLRDSGYHGDVYVGDAATSANFSGLSGNGVGDLYAFSSPTAKYMQSAKAFGDAYKAKFSVDPGLYGVLSYDGMKLLDAAIGMTSSHSDSKALVDALQKADYKDGVTGEISFLPDHTLASSNVILLQWGDPGWIEDRGIVCPTGQVPCGNSCCVK